MLMAERVGSLRWLVTSNVFIEDALSCVTAFVPIGYVQPLLLSR